MFKPALGINENIPQFSINYYRVVSEISYKGNIWKPGDVILLHKKIAQRFVDESRLVKLEIPKFSDVFSAGVELPKTVIILGSGPNGIPVYPKITESDFVISTNAAINCPVKSSLWTAMDPTLRDQKYFQAAMQNYYEKYYLPGFDLSANGIGKGYPVAVMERNRVARYFPFIKLTFKLDRNKMMRPGYCEPIPGAARPGATIAGAVIQLCYWFGVKYIRLCGIDMFGALYFDGSKHKRSDRINRDWGCLRTFNALIDTLEKKGMRFTTLSKTRLRVELEK